MYSMYYHRSEYICLLGLPKYFLVLRPSSILIFFRLNVVLTIFYAQPRRINCSLLLLYSYFSTLLRLEQFQKRLQAHSAQILCVTRSEYRDPFHGNINKTEHVFKAVGQQVGSLMNSKDVI